MMNPHYYYILHRKIFMLLRIAKYNGMSLHLLLKRQRFDVIREKPIK